MALGFRNMTWGRTLLPAATETVLLAAVLATLQVMSDEVISLTGLLLGGYLFHGKHLLVYFLWIGLARLQRHTSTERSHTIRSSGINKRTECSHLQHFPRPHRRHFHRGSRWWCVHWQLPPGQHQRDIPSTSCCDVCGGSSKETELKNRF
jgi:hypothetical protein